MATADRVADHEYIEDKDQNAESAEGNGEIATFERTFGFDMKTARTDLVLIVQGTQLHVIRVVLEMTSPVFEELFREKLREEGQNQLEIEEQSLADFVELLACVYPGKMHEVTPENVNRILPLVFKYNVDFLRKRCETVLLESLKTVNTEENVLHCMNEARKYNMNGLKEECVKLTVMMFEDDIQRVDEIAGLNPDLKISIYDALIPKLRSEISKFRFWSAGINKERSINPEHFDNAMYTKVESVVDWNKFTSDYKDVEDEAGILWDRVKLKVKLNTSGSYMFMSIHGDLDTLLGCHVAVVFILQNYLPLKDNIYRKTSAKFTSTSTTSSPLNVAVKDIFKRDSGFLCEGKLKLCTHILVNKPIFKKDM